VAEFWRENCLELMNCNRNISAGMQWKTEGSWFNCRREKEILFCTTYKSFRHYRPVTEVCDSLTEPPFLDFAYFLFKKTPIGSRLCFRLQTQKKNFPIFVIDVCLQFKGNYIYGVTRNDCRGFNLSYTIHLR